MREPLTFNSKLLHTLEVKGVCSVKYLHKMIDGYKDSLQRLTIFNKEELQALTFELPDAPNL